MASANNQKQSSLVRRLRFTSRGGTYNALFMSDRGDLYQQYISSPNSTDDNDFIPDFVQNPTVLRTTINSSSGSGTVNADSYSFYVNTTLLTFGSDGFSTNVGMQGVFKKVNDELHIVKNVAAINSGASFDIRMVAAIGNDTVSAVCPVSVSKYVEGAGARVTIAPDSTVGGNHNFTITDTLRQIGLKVIVTKDKNEYDAPTSINGEAVHYEWYKLVAGAWSLQDGKTTGRLTVTADDVDTYTHYRVVVRLGGPAGEVIGEDAQTVFDASDPLDIDVSIIMSKDGTASAETSDYSEEFNDDMPPAAYISYTATLMRDGNAVTDNVTWKEMGCYNAAGVHIFNITPTTHKDSDGVTRGDYKVTVKDFTDTVSSSNNSPTGDYDLIIEAEIQ